MAIPIRPTPKLNEKESEEFLNQVKNNLEKKTETVFTPNLSRTIKRIMADARRNQKRNS